MPGVGKGDERRVAGINRTWANVRLEDANGNARLWRPGNLAAANGGVEVYRGEAMGLRCGSKVRLTRHDPGSGLTNGDAAAVESIDRGLRARNLKGRHVEALVREWFRRGLSHATMKNRLAHVRWWANKVGKPNVVKSNADYGLRLRSQVSDGTRRRDLDAEKLARVKDAHVRMALRLQAAFGLRREEAIKFRPRYADRGDHIAVKASTAKGGRPRDAPVLKDEQRRGLDEARTLAGAGAMIPPERNYAEQKRVYMDETKAAGFDHMHGLRHAYALDRYDDLTGWKALAAGGPPRHTLKADKVRLDTAARLTIAAELGHSRLEVARQCLAV